MQCSKKGRYSVTCCLTLIIFDLRKRGKGKRESTIYRGIPSITLEFWTSKHANKQNFLFEYHIISQDAQNHGNELGT